MPTPRVSDLIIIKLILETNCHYETIHIDFKENHLLKKLFKLIQSISNNGIKSQFCDGKL